mgnify:CR=1 FL=1
MSITKKKLVIILDFIFIIYKGLIIIEIIIVCYYKGPEDLKNKIGIDIINMIIDNYVRYSKQIIMSLNKIKSFYSI